MLRVLTFLLAIASFLTAMSLSTGLKAQALVELEPPSGSLSPQESLYFREERLAPVVIANPTLDEVPNFLNDLDEHLMSEELVQQLEDRYSMQLQFFSMQYGLIQHSRDSRIRRNIYGSAEQEAEIRNQMTSSIRHYMLVRGLPKFLTSKESTKFIGEQYTQAVKVAQSAARVEIKSDDGKWKFNGGGNPLSTKMWLKYSSPTSVVELYDFLNRSNDLAVVAFTNIGRYTPRLTYLIEQNTLVPGLRFNINKNLQSQVYSNIPLGSSSIWESSSHYLSARYTF